MIIGTKGLGQGLVCIMFLLIIHPQICKKLREDLKGNNFSDEMTLQEVLKGFPVLVRPLK